MASEPRCLPGIGVVWSCRIYAVLLNTPHLVVVVLTLRGFENGTERLQLTAAVSLEAVYFRRHEGLTVALCQAAGIWVSVM